MLLIFAGLALQANATVDTTNRQPTRTSAPPVETSFQTAALTAPVLLAPEIATEPTPTAPIPLEPGIRSPFTPEQIDPPPGAEAPTPALIQLALLLPPRPEPRPDGPSVAPAKPEVSPAEQRIARLRQKIHFQRATREDCLPRALVNVIYEIAEKFGDVRIISTHRSPRHNARVGGASKSFHLECRAIDFAVAGSHKGLVEFVRNRREVGGFKRYPHGFLHIDNGPRRTW